MKNILLLAHDDGGQEARFQAALDLGRALEGHITCLDVTYIPPVLGSGYYDDSYAVAEMVTQEMVRENANKQTLKARLAKEDVPWDWIDVSGSIADCLERFAKLADVIVVDRRLGDYSFADQRGTASDVIVRSGSPVLAVPPDCRRLDLGSVMVAWDGSSCAATALRTAVPLLKRAEQVAIVEAEDGSVIVPVEDAARYLSRHGIHPLISRLKARPHGAGEALLARAASGEYGYVVMGGFGHRRFVEALFGGVTRAMLMNSPVPVFLAH
ncbi:MAG: universal stress protein [Candidatus Sphingomonas colombiensis]|nr:universal stress protein [Sphingomonas sp.]WEK43219.1 MAG: universal stress protein [Sphingomonas sp.]